MKKYLPRIIDDSLNTHLGLFGAVLIRGCKWCGKTTTAEQVAKSTLKMQDPDEREANFNWAKIQPSILLKGEKPRLLDEWQNTPELWDAVRTDVDNSGLKGQYILTGSATPKTNHPLHSGVGRIARITMWPMSLYESGDSTNEVSLKDDLFADRDISGASNVSIEDYAFLAARGGWPAAINNTTLSATQYAKQYVESLINEDLTKIEGIRPDPERAKGIINSLARNISSPVSLATIKRDNPNVDERSINKYLDALSLFFVIWQVPTWSPNLRSKAILRTTKKRYFADPSIAVAALKASQEGILKDFNTFELIFENLVMRDLNIYAQSMNGELYYYRDNNDNEIDAIIKIEDGRFGIIEIKLGGDENIDKAANSLIRFKQDVDLTSGNAPDFMAVITASKYAYRREDGVYVVPIGCLKP